MDASSPAAAPAATIVVVGPTLPFRGGISQYNTLLLRACRVLRPDTRFFSFSRQYPKWLYPGNSDREPASEGYAEPGTRYTIDSINPVTWWRTAREVSRLAPDLVVFHWWTWFWAPCFAFMVRMLRRRGVRVAFICHNLADHDAHGPSAWISRCVIGMADAYLVHSSGHARELAASRPGRPVAMHPIPVYGHYPPATGALAKRGRLELLFFGFIRPYKGLDVLLQALEMLTDDEIHLTIIGEHWGDPTPLVERTEGRPGIELKLGYVSDEEAAEYFTRADFVMLPYVAATPSAVASVALHYDTPVIASRVAGLVDVVIEGATGMLVPPGDPAALADVLRVADRAAAAELRRGIAAFKQENSWETLCQALAGLAVVGGKKVDSGADRVGL